MGLLDKLKGVFFEEEYVEEEIKPKKEKEPIAKKIDLPENTTISKKEEVKVVEEQEEVEEPREEEQNYRFPMNFEDEDFKQDTLAEVPLVRESHEIKKVEEELPIEEEPIYHQPYASRDEKRERSTFKASPIISPIYGVLDKNYKKEEIVTKKEIHLSSATRKFDVDSIREKAYGDLASEITASIMDEEEPETVYDLLEDSSPAVASVTVGDAEEYFDDLGLEYNVDYEDNSTKAKSSRRSGRKAIIEVEDDEEDVVIDKIEELQEIIEKSDDNDIEDHLFDLVDSMYEDKE
jgi:hypothetical protein